MRFRSVPPALLAILSIAGGCGGEPPPAAEFLAPAGTLAPELNLGADGRAYLSWVQQQDGAHQLQYAVLDGEQWSETRTAAAGTGWLVSQVDWPGVTETGEGQLVAYWQQRRGTSGYASQVQIAFSPDQGATWNPALPLHDDNTETEHGFVNLLPDTDRLHVLWLDGRDTAAHAETHGHEGATALRHAVFDTNGQRLSEAVVDARTCDCCHLATARIPGGFILTYRDRSETNVRDIVTRRYVNGAWQEPVPVHADGWQLDGCPVNGPAIAANGTTVTVAWFTGVNDQPQVLAAISENAGESFSAPVRIDRGHALGRVDIAPLPGGDAVVSWTEMENNSAAFEMRRLTSPQDEPGPIRRLPARDASGFPRLLAIGDRLLVAWTEGKDTASRVRAMLIDPAGI